MGELAELTITFTAPDALSHKLFTTQQDFQSGEANRVDAASSHGNLILDMNDQIYEYPLSGTLTKLFVDAGSGSNWGDIVFTGGYPDESAGHSRI